MHHTRCSDAPQWAFDQEGQHCVYVVPRYRPPNRYKIGMTKNIGQRLTAFQREDGALRIPAVLVLGLDRQQAFDVEQDTLKLLNRHRFEQETVWCPLPLIISAIQKAVFAREVDATILQMQVQP